MSDLELEPNVDIGLLFISQAIDPLHELPAEASEDGDRGALAARVALWDDVIRKAGDLRDLAAQALGHLMEDDAEHVDGVGRVTRDRAVSTKWDRGKAVTDIKQAVVRRVGLDVSTGEQVQAVVNGARLALDEFVNAISPPTPRVLALIGLGLAPHDYRTTETAHRWTVKIEAD